MKEAVIVSGNFSPNGNFSGYDGLGERIFISKRQIANLGWSKDSDVKYPFYSTVVTKEFDKLDEEGNPTGEKFNRTQAGAIFATAKDYAKAVNATAALGIAVKQDLAELAKSAGISMEDLVAAV